MAPLYIPKTTMAAATATMEPTNGSRQLDTETAEVMLATGDPSPIPNPVVAPPKPGLLEFNMLGGMPNLLGIKSQNAITSEKSILNNKKKP